MLRLNREGAGGGAAHSPPWLSSFPGVYRKPSLSAHWGSSSKKTPSKQLSPRYHSETWFDAFVLSRNGRVEFAQNLSSKYEAGAFEADFPVNAIFLMHPGTYRCYYGLHKNFPYLWAEPSDVPMLPERGEGSPRFSPAPGTPRLWQQLARGSSFALS